MYYGVLFAVSGSLLLINFNIKFCSLLYGIIIVAEERKHRLRYVLLLEVKRNHRIPEESDVYMQFHETLFNVHVMHNIRLFYLYLTGLLSIQFRTFHIKSVT